MAGRCGSMSIRQRLRARLARMAEQILLDRGASLGSVPPQAEALKARFEGLGDKAQALQAALQSARPLYALTPDTTVAIAWRLHPAVSRVFAGHHLARCTSCPVRHDETLAEVARGHGIDLDGLLAELQAALQQPAAP